MMSDYSLIYACCASLTETPHLLAFYGRYFYINVAFMTSELVVGLTSSSAQRNGSPTNAFGEKLGFVCGVGFDTKCFLFSCTFFCVAKQRELPGVADLAAAIGACI